MTFQETFNQRVIAAGDRAFGVSVTITHGGRTTDSFTAQWEKKLYQVADNDGFITSTVPRDFTFPKAVAAIGSAAFEPRAGDLITLTENGVEGQYEVLPIGQLPAVELMPGGYRWLVHTKRVS